MASNQSNQDRQIFPGYGVANALDPNGSYAAYTPAAQTPATPTPSYPSWLTDLTARGLGSDWSPSIGPAPGVLTPDDYTGPPASAPAPSAPSQPSQPSQGYDPGTNADGQGEGGDTGSNNDGTGGWGGGDNSGSPDAGVDSGEDSGPQGNSNDGQGAQNSDGGYGGSSDDGGADSDSGDSGGSDGGDSGGGPDGGDSGGDGGGGDYKGGVITPNKLVGPNPPGPDDGYGKLKLGEGVITAKAMKFYGPSFLAKLNKLQVPKAAKRA